MAKINPFALARPPRWEWTVTLSDPSHPDLQLVLTLCELNVIEQLSALERAEALAVKYVKGRGRQGEADYQPPLPFPPVGGQAIESLSERALEAACLIERAQVGPPEDRYSAQEVVALMVVPGFAKTLLEAASRVEGSADPFGEETVGPAPPASAGG